MLLLFQWSYHFLFYFVVITRDKDNISSYRIDEIEGTQENRKVFSQSKLWPSQRQRYGTQNAKYVEGCRSSRKYR